MSLWPPDDEDVMTGLAGFLHVLARQPSPDDVVRALLDGPLTEWGGRGVSLWRLEGQSLLMVATRGFPEQDTAPFAVVPLATDIPVTRAVRDQDIVVVFSGGLHREFPLPYDGIDWPGMSTDLGSVVAAPLLAAGVPIGGIAFGCRLMRNPSAQDVAILEAVGSAIALWLGNPANGIVPPPEPPPAHLTERQVAILRLIAAGRSTGAVAAALSYSESTVKQEVRRILQSFRVADRVEAVERARALGLLEEAS